MIDYLKKIDFITEHNIQIDVQDDNVTFRHTGFVFSTPLSNVYMLGARRIIAILDKLIYD